MGTYGWGCAAHRRNPEFYPCSTAHVHATFGRLVVCVYVSLSVCSHVYLYACEHMCFPEAERGEHLVSFLLLSFILCLPFGAGSLPKTQNSCLPGHLEASRLCGSPVPSLVGVRAAGVHRVLS